MSNELITTANGTPAELVAVEQMAADRKDLIRRTVAPDATPQELDLFIYDCLRRRTHPLDRMIHFTKRGGRYTPITGIDYMRSLAGETGEHAGTDDAAFEEAANGGPPLRASVTVYRLTQGVRYAYAASAYWYEYFPGEKLGFMWNKMPHVMLAKVAEALALRKAFPRQLGGLYERAELDQAQAKSEAVEIVEPTKPAEKCPTCRSPLLPGETGECPGCKRTAAWEAMPQKMLDKVNASGGGESLPGAAPAAETTAGPMQVGDVLNHAVSGIAVPAGIKALTPQAQQRRRAFALMEKHGVSNDVAHRPDRLAIYGKALGLKRLATEKEAKAFTAEQWSRICSWIIETNEPPLEDQPVRQAVSP